MQVFEVAWITRYTKTFPPVLDPRPTDERILEIRCGSGNTYGWDSELFRDASGNLCGPYLSYSEW